MTAREGETKRINLGELRGDQPQSTDADAVIRLEELPPGAIVEVRTESRTYVLQWAGKGQAKIHGHPRYCPDPIDVMLYGSSWGENAVTPLVIRRGTCLVYRHPSLGLVRTSRIREARQIDPTSGTGGAPADR